jgi:hypothetical protein
MSVQHRSSRVQHLIGTANQSLEKQGWFTRPENLIVDFDWRFQKDTAERLADMLLGFRNVICVGTPTVFSLLSAVRRTDVLIDQNPYYERVLSSNDGRVICSTIEDFNCLGFEKRFDAALLDPPWNLVDYKSWLQAVLPMIAIRGSLFIPIFPNLLREGVESDLWSLTQTLSNFGQISVVPFKVRYDTPTFEEEVLRRKGLPPLHGWRSAAMIEVRVDRSAPGRPKTERPKESWDRLQFGRTVVAIKDNHWKNIQSAKGQFFFLNSVSNRDETRRQITAVSSRNVATDFQNTSLLSQTLRSIASSSRVLSHVDPLIVASEELGSPYD